MKARSTVPSFAVSSPTISGAGLDRKGLKPRDSPPPPPLTEDPAQPSPPGVTLHPRTLQHSRDALSQTILTTTAARRPKQVRTAPRRDRSYGCPAYPCSVMRGSPRRTRKRLLLWNNTYLRGGGGSRYYAKAGGKRALTQVPNTYFYFTPHETKISTTNSFARALCEGDEWLSRLLVPRRYLLTPRKSPSYPQAAFSPLEPSWGAGHSDTSPVTAPCSGSTPGQTRSGGRARSFLGTMAAPRLGSAGGTRRPAPACASQPRRHAATAFPFAPLEGRPGPGGPRFPGPCPGRKTAPSSPPVGEAAPRSRGPRPTAGLGRAEECRGEARTPRRGQDPPETHLRPWRPRRGCDRRRHSRPARLCAAASATRRSRPIGAPLTAGLRADWLSVGSSHLGATRR